MYSKIVDRRKEEHVYKRLKNGGKFLKHGRRGKPHTRWLTFSPEFDRVQWRSSDKKEIKGEESVLSIQTIEKGKVFKRTGKVGREDHYFSIVFKERSLDLEAETPEECNMWVEDLMIFCAARRREAGKSANRSWDQDPLEAAIHTLAKWSFDIESEKWQVSKSLSRGAKMTDEDMNFIAPAIDGNPVLTTLLLGDNSLTDKCMYQLTDAMKRSYVTHLDLSQNDITDDGVTYIANLPGLMNTGGIDSVASSSATVPNRYGALHTLDLSHNDITSIGAESIAAMLRKNRTLTKINLDKNHINDEGAIALADSLDVNRALVELSLNGNEITNEGARALARAYKNHPSLKILNLADNKIVFKTIETPSRDDTEADAEADANAEDGGLDVELFLAVEESRYADVILLCLDGANPNIQNSEDGQTPLHLATSRGDVQLVSFLLDYHSIDMNAVDDQNCTPLFVAMRESRHEVVKMLLERGAELMTPDSQQITVMHLAAQQGNRALLKLFVETHKAPLNPVAADGSTPLHIAAQHNYEAIVEYLLAKNWEIRERDPEHYEDVVNFQDALGESPLHKVFHSMQPNTKIATMLVQKGANIALVDNEGKSPMDSPNTNAEIRNRLMTESRAASILTTAMRR